jgi:adenylate cyclase
VTLEIERKFLADTDNLPELYNGVDLCQGYLPTSNLTVARVRLAGAKAFLTIKGPNRSNPESSPRTSNGAAKTQIIRSEFEYEIPSDDARQMLAEFCGVVV